MSDAVRVQVLMKPEDASRFEHFCETRGHKKSTLIAKLIRDHLDREERSLAARVSGARH